MISLTSSHSSPLERHWCEPGGFFWWYCDHLDDSGTGFVCIWSWSLPFLPGVTSAARKGKGLQPQSRPSLNVAIYREGKLIDYYLLSYEKSRASYDRVANKDETVESFEFGESSIKLTRKADTCQVDAALRLPVPGSAGRALIGEFHGEGPLPVLSRTGQHQAEDDEDVNHRWAMICPAMSLTADWRWPNGATLGMSGAAYLDRNDSLVAIDQLGIEDWFWGRAHLGGKTFVWYLLHGEEPSDPPRSYGFEVEPDGTVTAMDLTVETMATEQAMFGMRRATRTVLKNNDQLWLDLEESAVIDDGPFYLRTLMRATDSQGAEALAIAESVRPSRVDRKRHRFLVQMRVQYDKRLSSMWLPLFCGPRGSRWRRLFNSWLPGSRRPLLPASDQSSDSKVR
jgi:hypothetical protein